MPIQLLHHLPIAFAEAGSQPGWVNFLPFVAVFAIFYFLLIAPMRKRQKAQQSMIAALKKGDKVITNGGLYGEVVAVHDDVARRVIRAINGTTIKGRAVRVDFDRPRRATQSRGRGRS